MNSHIQANAYDLRTRAFTNEALWHGHMSRFEVSHPEMRLVARVHMVTTSHLYDQFDHFHTPLFLSVKMSLIPEMTIHHKLETYVH